MNRKKINRIIKKKKVRKLFQKSKLKRKKKPKIKEIPLKITKLIQKL